MKSFQINILVKIILISANIFLIQYIYLNTEYTATLFLLFAIIVVQIFNLINYINITNREITRFLLSIRHSDFSQNFTMKKYGKSFSYLGNAMNEVIREFQNTRSENEENLRYLETVLHHIDIGLISFSEDGKISFINNAAKKLLNINHLVNIKNLSTENTSHFDRLINIRPGKKNILKLSTNDEIVQIVCSATKFKQRNKAYTLVSLQNIQNELEEQELQAWNKLIRVLTHEIMNSITPISSLAGTVKTMLLHSDLSDCENNDETLEDITEAVTTIEKRSIGLINFVDNYRSLTRIPNPNFKIVKISDIFSSIQQLFQDSFESKKIDFELTILPANLDLTTDPELLEQVLINLVKNSIEALETQIDKEIKLKSYLNLRGNPVIEVKDNGSGIQPEVLEKLFIPFFTTKQNGSGIGLSLSKQIIRTLGGNIKVSSDPKTGTMFSLNFYR